MKYTALLALLALAACSGRSPPAEAPANAALRAQCTREANASPGVEDAIAIAAGRSSTALDVTTGVNETRRDAIEKCLQAHGGLGLGGGVEVPN